MDITTMRIAATLACFATFVTIFAWAWIRGRRGGFDDVANLPFAPEREEQP